MLETLRIPKRKFPCAVRTFWETLDPADQEILMSNLCDFSIGHKTLEKALSNVGITLSDTAISRHRTGLCSCSRI